MGIALMSTEEFGCMAITGNVNLKWKDKTPQSELHQELDEACQQAKENRPTACEASTNKSPDNNIGKIPLL